MPQKPEISAGLMDHLARMQTNLPYPARERGKKCTSSHQFFCRSFFCLAALNGQGENVAVHRLRANPLNQLHVYHTCQDRQYGLRQFVLLVQASQDESKVSVFSFKNKYPSAYQNKTNRKKLHVGTLTWLNTTLKILFSAERGKPWLEISNSHACTVGKARFLTS